MDGENDVFGEFQEALFLDKMPSLDKISSKSKQPYKKQYMVAQTYFDKVKDGSLLDLFESPHMTSHMIIYYLFKATKKHIVEYLVNKLYREYRHDIRTIDFYLSQLCFMCITKSQVGDLSMPIERFIL